MVFLWNMDISYWSRGRYKLADSQHYQKLFVLYAGILCRFAQHSGIMVWCSHCSPVQPVEDASLRMPVEDATIAR